MSAGVGEETQVYCRAQVQGRVQAGLEVLKEGGVGGSGWCWGWWVSGRV